MIGQVLLIRKIMHCKFLVFLLIVFFFFSFFSSACEFRFIERIGAHGKQNPDFIIIIIITVIIILKYFIFTAKVCKKEKHSVFVRQLLLKNKP